MEQTPLVKSWGRIYTPKPPGTTPITLLLMIFIVKKLVKGQGRDKGKLIGCQGKLRTFSSLWPLQGMCHLVEWEGGPREALAGG